jgi:hypothetical protein
VVFLSLCRRLGSVCLGQCVESDFEVLCDRALKESMHLMDSYLQRVKGENKGL